MKIIETIGAMQSEADEIRLNHKIIGVVPTMGYLHDGHLSLIKVAKQNADIIIVTVFVNPTQFAPHEDFHSYPRDIIRDARLAESAGADILFVPSTSEIYQSDFLTKVNVEYLSAKLEGKSRPGHFQGVTTIVAKLFNITKPHIAIFGQKDGQQVIMIKRMVQDLNFGVKIIIAPTMREPDGLAMSSRNTYLRPSERSESTVLFASLKEAENLINKGIRNCLTIKENMSKLILSRKSADIDYISIADPSTLDEYEILEEGRQVLISLAVRIGKTRLIDNILINI
ncbi:MAG: pantoate--beta-alanine ligase [Ignavibacteriales bacterium]|nr:pantoate--beta-alanine ligase [Ignavibacteriales bacterium]